MVDAAFDNRQEELFDDVVECSECGYEYAKICGDNSDDTDGIMDRAVLMECMKCGHRWER